MCSVARQGGISGRNNSSSGFQGNTVRAEAGLVRVKPGDQVLVHAGCILQVLSETEGRQLRELFEELEEIAGEGNS